MVTVTPSRDSFTSAALQRLEAVDHGFDARAGDTGFFHQPRVLFVQVVLLGLERVILALESLASLMSSSMWLSNLDGPRVAHCR
jgi:hypothetical protein